MMGEGDEFETAVHEALCAPESTRKLKQTLGDNLRDVILESLRRSGVTDPIVLSRAEHALTELVAGIKLMFSAHAERLEATIAQYDEAFDEAEAVNSV